MDLQQLPSTVFRIRPDGVVEMSIAGAEIMFHYIVFCPLSWSQIVEQIRSNHALEHRDLDTYALIYSFCVAMNTSDPVLYRCTGLHGGNPWVNESFNRFRRLDDWSFWDRAGGGIYLRRLAFNLSTNPWSINPSDAFQIWSRFCRLVDYHGRTPSYHLVSQGP